MSSYTETELAAARATEVRLKAAWEARQAPGEPGLKHVSQLTPAEADQRLAEHMAKLADEDRSRRANPYAEKKSRVWTDTEIAEVNERAAAWEAKQEAQRRDPTLKLPDHLRGKSAVDMSPVEYDEVSRILGLPRVSSMELDGQQAAWLRKHGRG